MYSLLSSGVYESLDDAYCSEAKRQVRLIVTPMPWRGGQPYQEVIKSAKDHV
jgi:hypothetical protein